MTTENEQDTDLTLDGRKVSEREYLETVFDDDLFWEWLFKQAESQ